MRPRNFLFCFLAIFLVFLLSWGLSMNWNSLYTAPKSIGLSLMEYDTKIAPEQEACFSLQIESNFAKKTNRNLTVIANQRIALEKEVDVSKNPLLKECLSAEFFSEGENFVEMRMEEKRVFYHLSAEDGVKESVPVLALESLPGTRDKVIVTVTNNPDTAYTPVEIYVNGKLDHRAYFSGENFSSAERIELREGKNEVKAVFLGQEDEIYVEKPLGFKMNPFLGLIVLSLLLCVLAFLVFPKKGFFERISFSILAFFSIVCVVFFLLYVSGILSAQNFVAGIIVVAVALAVFFRKNFRKPDSLFTENWKKRIKSFPPLLFMLLCMILFSSLFFNFFTPTYFGVWTSFYERQSRTIMETQEIPVTDEYSFLGTKPFGYMTGYFFLNPGISWLTGLPTQQSYAIIMILSQLALIASAFLFFGTFGLGRKAYIAVAVSLFGGFVFSDFSFNIRHVVSYAFLFMGMYMLRKNNAVGSGLALGFGTFFQAPLFAMCLVLAPVIITKKEGLKTLAVSLSVAALTALVFFAPTLLQAGIPTQAMHNVWGHFWSIPLYGFVLDYLSILLLIALFIVPFVFLKKVKFTAFSLRVLAFLLLFIFIQLFVSYRINVPATITFALLVALLFPADFVRDRLREYSMSSFFALGYAFMFIVIIAFYPVTPYVSDAAEFVKENTSTEANILNEPYLGHPLIHLAERKASADLAVEYANQGMIEDSYKFIKNKNPEILGKYGIDYVFTRSVFLDEKPVGDNWHWEVIEFPFLDKVYANEYLMVHRERKNT